MSFVPALYENLGKASADLFKKKFDYKNQVQLKNKSATGVTFTSTGEVSDKGVSGSVNLKYKEKRGEVDTELTTCGKAKAEFKTKNLAPGVVLTVKGESNPKRDGALAGKAGAKAPAVKATVDYTQEFFAGSVAVDTSLFDYTLVTASGVIGYDGLSVGGELKVDANTRSELEDYNVAAQYQQKDMIATVKTESKAERLTLSYYQDVSSQQAVGAQLAWALDGSDDRKLQLGTAYKVDDVTSFKVKGAAAFKAAGTEGEVAGVIEHRLRNPSLLFALSSSYKVANAKSFSPDKFGVALTFGDFE